MKMYIFMYVCMHACMHVCMYIYIHTCLNSMLDLGVEKYYIGGDCGGVEDVDAAGSDDDDAGSR